MSLVEYFNEGGYKNHPVRFIDLFAGIGGIRLGFEGAFPTGKTVFVSEWDEFAQKTYKANFKDDFDIAGDITKVNEKDIPPFDICLAGFPCQAFSLAGKRQGFKDDYRGLCRGTLFQDVVRICDEHKAKSYFLLERQGNQIVSDLQETRPERAFLYGNRFQWRWNPCLSLVRTESIDQQGKSKTSNIPR